MEEEFKVLNGFWKGEGTESEVNLYPCINLGISYDKDISPYIDYEKTEIKGERLKVLALRNAHLLDLKTFSDNMDTLLKRAQKGIVSIDDVTEYTFIFNNIGVLGFEFGDSILPAGVSGMLNMGAVHKNGDVALQVCFDHRMCDGARAAAFVKAVVKKASSLV